MGVKIDLKHVVGTATATSGVALAGNSKLKYLMIVNKSSANILYVSFGVASSVAIGVPIPVGGSLTFGDKEVLNDINVVADTSLTAEYLIVHG